MNKKLNEDQIQDLAVLITESIENGYKVIKVLNHIQKEFKLNDLQISNIEELITNWNYVIEDNLADDYEWHNFIDLVVKEINKRI
jgi:hypothetical protein